MGGKRLVTGEGAGTGTGTGTGTKTGTGTETVEVEGTGTGTGTATGTAAGGATAGGGDGGENQPPNQLLALEPELGRAPRARVVVALLRKIPCHSKQPILRLWAPRPARAAPVVIPSRSP